jgi:transposase
MEDSLLEQIKMLSAEGLSQRDIAKEANCSLSMVNRLLKKSKQVGNYD